MPKPFKKFSEQVNILIKRGMRSSQGLTEQELRDKIIIRLMYVNYYRLSAYWQPYLHKQKSEQTGESMIQFNAHTYWEDIWGRYMFDRRLRNILFDAISRIEIALRTQLAYQWAYDSRMEQPQAHAEQCMKSYDNESQEARQSKLKQRDDTLKCIENNFIINREVYASIDPEIGQAQNALSLPVWSYVEFATLGNLATLLRICIKNKVVKRISQMMGIKNAKLFVSGISLLKDVRNSCAHQSRIWDRTWSSKKRTPILIQKETHDANDQISAKLQSITDVDKTAAVLTLCRIILKKIAPESQWKNRVLDLMRSNLIPIGQLNKSLGFKDDKWYEHELWL